jgi:hypothetical protein
MPGSIELFKAFPSDVFIETGTFHGNGVEMALAAGFPQVISIELSPELFSENQKRFKNNPKVKLFHGDSGDLMPQILEDIHCDITFWLDGHASGGETACGRDISPILRELNAIARHPNKTHSILIDDVRLFLTHNFGEISLGDVAESLWAINPEYLLQRFDGHVPMDVLTASIA